MAMLDRYKKTGGFNQLLSLLETCGVPKRQKFLEIIRQEDARWADALVAKMVDLPRFLAWPDAAIAEVTGAMLEINVASVISSLEEAQQTRLMATLPHIKRRKVEDLLMTQKSSPGEVATSLNKMFETIRKLASDGILRLDKIDPNAYVDSDIEDRLKQGKDIVGVISLADSIQDAPFETPQLSIVRTLGGDAKQAPAMDGKDSKYLEHEIANLKKKLIVLQQENASLRQELATAQGKLDQIRKLS